MERRGWSFVERWARRRVRRVSCCGGDERFILNVDGCGGPERVCVVCKRCEV